jgi:hypothetical protein
LGLTVEAADAERSSGLCRVASGDLSASTGSGMVTGNLGVWFLIRAGLQPKTGNIEPHPTMRNCWTIEKTEVVIQ